jgi:hypothetical protein
MFSRDRVAGLALLLFALVVLWEDRVLPLGTVYRPGPGFMPMVLALALAGLALVVMAASRGTPPLASLDWTEKRHAAAILAGSAFVALALERLGYRLTILVLVGFLLWAIERKRPAVALALAIGLSLGTWYVFAGLLKVPLPLGPRGF